ncbi:MAG: DEAD/DEAH box helicase [Acidimicrobiia bacterium]|nr:DEAD/DEAH box helicase [Acidimicrobiia bacterium]
MTTSDHSPTDTPDDADEPDSGFASLGLRHEVLEAVSHLGYEEPTPIQREAVPVLIAGRDLLGQAATGTGKTAAFALPILEQLSAADTASTEPFALVLVPTRELAVQVSEAVYRYGRQLRVRVLPVFGGQPIGRQLSALRKGVDVVVATPGRAVDHVNRGSLRLDRVRMVVLDEADEMLDMGFADDLEAILEATPAERQTVLFSATLPKRIDQLARSHQRNPERIRIAAPRGGSDETPLVRQRVHFVARHHKTAALARVLDVDDPTATIVFCRTRLEVDQVTEALNARGFRAEALHGGMDQQQRDRVMGRLRSGTAELLVATDVAARGLDVDQLTHVVNYDVPSAPESYVHRIGRVGRAGREGVAITLAEPRERRLLGNIERLTRQSIPVEAVPSVAELRARQHEQLAAALRSAADRDDLGEPRAVVDALTDEIGITDIAVAAVRLLADASGTAADEIEIPEAAPPNRKGPGGKGPGKGPGSAGRGRTGGHSGSSQGRSEDGGDGTVTKLFVGLGSADGLRPKDLVGAIANETRLSGRQIGPIRINERFSTVGVPSDAADEVIDAMRRSAIRGRKASIRRDRHG